MDIHSSFIISMLAMFCAAMFNGIDYITDTSFLTIIFFSFVFYMLIYINSNSNDDETI